MKTELINAKINRLSDAAINAAQIFEDDQVRVRQMRSALEREFSSMPAREYGERKAALEHAEAQLVVSTQARNETQAALDRVRSAEVVRQDRCSPAICLGFRDFRMRTKPTPKTPLQADHITLAGNYVSATIPACGHTSFIGSLESCKECHC